MASHTSTPGVDARLETILSGIEKNPIDAQDRVPGLDNLLRKYLAYDQPSEDLIRDFLRVFKDSSDTTYGEFLQRDCTREEQDRLKQFVSGRSAKDVGKDFETGPSIGSREELTKLEELAHTIAYVGAKGFQILKSPAEEIDAGLHHMIQGIIPGLTTLKSTHELEETPSLTIYKDTEFQNWSRSITNAPKYTCVPTNVAAIQVVVNYAKENNMSVRCSGLRHSWSSLFGQNGQIVISMLDIQTYSKQANATGLTLPERGLNQLQTIEIMKDAKPQQAGNTLVRIGSATTNECLRKWCIANKTMTLPFNTTMIEMTLGGMISPICLGAGRHSQTFSDLVRKIEYVDANGRLQIVEDPMQLRAASGCFGLIGVITHITLELSPMRYAKLQPKKLPVIQAIPPPVDLAKSDIPKALYQYWKDLSPAQKQACQRAFETSAKNNYNAEWFWYPYSDYAWVNNWDTTTDADHVEAFPSNGQLFLQWAQSCLMNILLNTPVLGWLVNISGLDETAVTLMSRAAMAALPENPVKSMLPDALQPLRNIPNVRVKNMEIEIPLVAQKDHPTEPNWQLVQRAWWDAIILTYANSKESPMAMPLEMHIKGNSNVIMAPLRGNMLGTCSIEMLTPTSVDTNLWNPFAQKLLNKWLALRDPATGQVLRTRPHWAKEWATFTVDNEPWAERLKQEYAQERMEFLETLSEIGRGAGWTLADLKARFSNPMLSDFFFKDVATIQKGTMPSQIMSSKTNNIKLNIPPVAKIY